MHQECLSIGLCVHVQCKIAVFDGGALFEINPLSAPQSKLCTCLNKPWQNVPLKWGGYFWEDTALH